ncbi:HD domain-containing protein [Candidatus Pacearchaeota archaeon]|nr:HD domain-containing protein [Candidatus Pacearchaeota archaeon]
MTKVETIFQKELNSIHNKDIKNFIITCFDKLCPDYFWTCPCSTTGKYHPQVSLGVGGLVRHTKLAVWWGLHLVTALGNSPELNGIPQNQLLDEITATLLLHDMLKNGKGLDSRGYPLEPGVTGTHGVTLAEKINVEMANNELRTNTYWRIIEGIRSHMGIWTTDPRYRPNTLLDPVRKAFAQLIHLADYCASRKVDEIYRKLQGEQDDLIQQTTETTIKTEITKSPACPGVRPTESRQTTTAES